MVFYAWILYLRYPKLEDLFTSDIVDKEYSKLEG